MPKLVEEATYSGGATVRSRETPGGRRRQLEREDLAAWRAFLRAHAAVMRRLERDLVDTPLSLSEYDLLATLVSAPEGTLRMKDLAERVLLTKSGITRLVDRLVERGFVARQSCPVDRRGQNAVVTDEGRAALRRAARVHLPGVAAAFAAHLDARERDTLAEALERVASANGAPLSGEVV